MKIVCAWCGRDIGEKDGKGVEGISHGVCKECFDRLGAKVGKRGKRRGAEPITKAHQ